MSLNIDYQEKFQVRHIAPNEADTSKMLQTVGVKSLDELIDQTIPAKIRLKKPLDLPPAKSEFDYLNTLRQTAILKPSIRNKHLSNLFFAGHLTVPGPGVPPAIISGNVAAAQLLNYLKN